MKRPIAALILFGFLLAGSALADGAYHLVWFTVDGGGSIYSTGTEYSLAGSVGQADAGLLSGGGYTLGGGFWGGGAVASGPAETHLPLVLRGWPPLAGAPVLWPISNPDVDGTYSVGWGRAERAETYVLQEATNGTFVNAKEVCRGASMSFEVRGRGAARYFYRVRGHNAWGDGPWSNVEWVDVLWEAEPNDEAHTQANGPIVSGLTYFGVFPSGDDEKDYYFFDLPTRGQVELWLTGVPSGYDYDLVLRDVDLEEVGKSDGRGDADEHILTGALPAARYYVQVYNWSRTGSTQAYHLRVVYE